MIELTRLNKKTFVLNSDLIKFIENTPDTVLTLVSGEKMVVLEPCQVIIDKVIEFRRKASVGLSSLSAAAGCDFSSRNEPPSAEDLED